MSWIYRISMKTKLAIALLPLLIALLWLAGAGMLARIDTERQMRNIEEVTRLAKSAGDVVHELQKERGLSAGYLGSKGAQFNNELTAQRSHTDDALKAFDAAMNGTDAGSLKGSVGEAIRAFQQRVSMLDETRQQITALSIPAPQGVAFYTDTISTVLELVGRSTHLSHAGVIVNEMVVYYSLLSMKEQAGVERALLSGIFFADHFSDGQLPRLSEVVGKQQALLAASRQLSDADGVKRIDETLALPSATARWRCARPRLSTPRAAVSASRRAAGLTRRRSASIPCARWRTPPPRSFCAPQANLQAMPAPGGSASW